MLDARTGDPWIVSDLVADPFYRILHYTYPVLSTLQARGPYPPRNASPCPSLRHRVRHL